MGAQSTFSPLKDNHVIDPIYITLKCEGGRGEEGEREEKSWKVKNTSPIPTVQLKLNLGKQMP